MTPPRPIVVSGHSNVAHPRTGPDPSDFRLFACAVVGIWWLRHALRRRGCGDRRYRGCED